MIENYVLNENLQATIVKCHGGDLLVGVVSDDSNFCGITFYESEIPLKIGENFNDGKSTVFDMDSNSVTLLFKRPESIDVFIHKLQKAKELLKGKI